MPSPALYSRMGRRFSVVLTIVALLPLAVLLLGGLAQTIENARSAEAARRALAAQAFAERIESRLAAAEIIARSLTQQDPGPEGANLARALEGVAMFTGVRVASPGADAATRGVAPGGPSVLRSVYTTAGPPALYLIRGVRVGDSERVAVFELSRQWVWGNTATNRETAMVVVDEGGNELYGATELSSSLLHMFVDRTQRSGAVSAPEAVSWQAAGREWEGALVPLELPAASTTGGGHWAVVGFERSSLSLAAAGPLGVAAAIAFALALALAYAAAGHLTRRYLPVLQALDERLRALSARRFSRHELVAPDELGDVGASLALAERALEEEFAARTTIAEVDRLLLGAAAIEQVMDAVLPRVQRIAGCDSVGIALLDPDAAEHGRVYATSKWVSALPVSRIAMDRDMLATLETAPQGITVARCEPGRHSFLQPQRDLGSEFFWLWPVCAGERLLAVLCIGFNDPPAPVPELAARGGEFASRLGLALSNSKREEQLYRQAHFDALTTLPNRLLFRERLLQELATATAGLARGAILYVDLDHFKRVNDSVGHAAGDQLLTIIAQRLRACVKEGDTVARLGGDEFGIILRNVSDPEAARAVADRVIESVQLPVDVAGRDHFVRASVGVTLFPDDGATIDDLMRNSDLAMYRAKESGRSRAMFFEPRMAGGSPRPGDSGLTRALRRREFALFYQPQFELQSGALVGVEALLRWHTPRDGMRPPREFVPAAEESGLIIDLGAWVLEAACQQLVAWRERGIVPPRVGLNVSAQQLRHAEFTRTVEKTLEKFAIPAGLIELELDETAFEDEGCGRALARLAALGVGLALCDGGSGYAALGALRKFPIRSVKIDRTFLESLPQHTASASLAETVIATTHALGKTVVGEGVETIEQLEFLRARGCDIVQGFYLSQPLSAPAATELLEGRVAAAGTSSPLRAAG
jgi:diguanylate cyclase (GGDEF)-like protein